MSIGTAGSLIMDAASLFFMAGILNYTRLYRKRGRPDDWLYFAMILVNAAMAVADGLAYFLEGRALPMVRETIIAANVIFFAAFALFGYLMLLYLDYRVYQDKERLRKMKIPAAVPFLILFILLLVNLKTGWIYLVGEDAIYHSGPMSNLVFVPTALYFAAGEVLAYKINVRLVALGALLIVSRIGWGFMFRDISSTALTYTLFLVCVHLHMMNAPLVEDKAKEGTV